MSDSERYTSLIAYIPILGWIYVLLFHHTKPLPMFHVRQSIGLFVFLLVVFAGWLLLAWVSVWIPYGFTFGIALFNVVIAAFIFGAVMWVKGMINALSGRMSLLPLFGQMANRILL
jgi:uncharacterized membrane protein